MLKHHEAHQIQLELHIHKPTVYWFTTTRDNVGLRYPATLFLHNKVITDYVRPDYADRMQQEKPYILVFMWKTETHR